MPKHTKLLMPCCSPLALTFPITVCLSSNHFHLFSGDSLVLHQEQPLNTNEQELATKCPSSFVLLMQIFCAVSKGFQVLTGVSSSQCTFYLTHTCSYLPSLIHLFLPPKMSIDCLSCILIQLNVEHIKQLNNIVFQKLINAMGEEKLEEQRGLCDWRRESGGRVKVGGDEFR